VKFAIELNGTLLHVEAERTGEHKVRFTLDGHTHEAEVLPSRGNLHSILTAEGAHGEALVQRDDDGGLRLYIHTHCFECRLYDALALKAREVGGGDEAQTGWALKAQMPGKVVKVLAAPGEKVEKGQPVLVVEAMKMQNEIPAPRDGTIKTVHAKPGAVVERGTLLVEAGPLQ